MRYAVVCLGADGLIRKEYFDNEQDANSVANTIKEFYGNPNVKVINEEVKK